MWILPRSRGSSHFGRDSIIQRGEIFQLNSRTGEYSAFMNWKLLFLHERFSCFLNCTNSTKSRNAPQFWLTLGEKGPKIRYFAFEDFVIWYSPKHSKMKILGILDFPLQIPCLTKVSFLSFGPKCCWPIRLHDCWKFNISRMTWVMKLIFLCSWAIIEASNLSRRFGWM